MRKIRGVYPPHNKNTALCAAEELPVPAQVHIPMSMSAGKPAKPIVSVGDEVKVGQLIGEASGFVSAHVHASVSGKVKRINERDPVTGQKAVSITIDSDGSQTMYEGLKPPTVTNREEFIEAVRGSGVVGLGGAGFPTAPKLTFKSKLDYILINGAECEPFVTSDTRTMVEDTEYVIEGARLLQKYYEPKEMLVCIEGNKPEAIAKMTEGLAGDKGIEVYVLPSSYPQGERKVLVYNVTGRIIPEGARLHETGCIVSNCTTVAVFAKYIRHGTPLTHKIVTVDGTAVNTPKNVLAPTGTPIKDLFEFCGGFKEEPKKILMGGTMMGFAVPSLELPVVKITNSVLAFLAKDMQEPVQTACIKCGRCIRKCPMSLMPSNIETAYELKKAELLEHYKVGMCVECGSCAYVCPAKRPLVQVLQLSKNLVWEHKEEKKAAAAKKAEKEAKKDE